MAVELIVVPYLLGREGVGMGGGPLALERDAIEVALLAGVVYYATTWPKLAPPS